MKLVGRQHHGAYKTAEYAAWKAMKWRCNPKNKASRKYYFERGIHVCAEWLHDFKAFLAHIGPMPVPGMEVDRIEGINGYQPGNVRWATRKQQMRNTDRALKITIGAETLSASEWAERSGIPLNTIVYRNRRKWPAEELLSPVRWKHRVGRCA